MLENFFSFQKQSIIKLVPATIGGFLLKIPVADIQGLAPGLTVVVTGGMDGDEYSGIEAAYRIIHQFQNGDFAGRLIVVPIVNIPGFGAECSQCPIDGQFPKNIFPGKAQGTPTEQLVHWLVSNYVSAAELWLDLHAGAITEGLNPFVYLFETDNDRVRACTEKMIEGGISSTVVMEPSRWGSKHAKLAEMGCTYVLAESGSRGNLKEDDVLRHIESVKVAFGAVGLIPAQKINNEPPAIFHEVVYVTGEFDGLWRAAAIGATIQKGDVLGEWCRLDGSDKKTIYAARSGCPLWWKETMRMQEGDVLCAIAWK